MEGAGSAAKDEAPEGLASEGLAYTSGMRRERREAAEAEAEAEAEAGGGEEPCVGSEGRTAAETAGVGGVAAGRRRMTRGGAGRAGEVGVEEGEGSRGSSSGAPSCVRKARSGAGPRWSAIETGQAASTPCR